MHRGGKRAPPNHPFVRSLRCKPWVGDWQHSKVFHSCSIGYCKEVQQGFPLCIEIIETWVISIHWVQCRDVSHATDYRGLQPCLTLLLFLSDTQNNLRNINLPALQLCVCLCVLVGFSVSKSRGVCVEHMCVKSIHSLFRLMLSRVIHVTHGCTICDLICPHSVHVIGGRDAIQYMNQNRYISTFCQKTTKRQVAKF